MQNSDHRYEAPRGEKIKEKKKKTTLKPLIWSILDPDTVRRYCKNGEREKERFWKLGPSPHLKLKRTTPWMHILENTTRLRLCKTSQERVQRRKMQWICRWSEETFLTTWCIRKRICHQDAALKNHQPTTKKRDNVYRAQEHDNNQ